MLKLLNLDFESQDTKSSDQCEISMCSCRLFSVCLMTAIEGFFTFDFDLSISAIFPTVSNGLTILQHS